MLLCILLLFLSNLSITKIIRPQMKLFDAPHNFYVNGLLDRRRYLVEDQPTSKVLMTNTASSNVDLPLNLTIQMIITPFQQIFSEEIKKVFSAKVKMRDGAILILNCVYAQGKKLKIGSLYTSKKGGESDMKELEQVIEPLKNNKISFRFNYQNIIVPEGQIQTIVQFQQSKPVFAGSVANLSITVHTNTSTVPIIHNSQPNQWIGTIDPISHPISLKGLVLPEKLQSKKPPHQIPILGKGKKLLVCHDMMNGYKQDINQYSNQFGKNAYRFQHWRITDIFVYFSHQNIAIPPKHYRMLCKKQKVVCLATFIIERPLDWLKFEMADFLIFLAREYQFDGYLINIEYPVSNPTLFKDWLTYLTNSIHTQLPNSLIVLYDAITDSGQLRHQSGLSENNIDYMRTVDYFFTDYHWNLQSLETTAALSESLDRGTDVFMGNDVFGRGTWGGGMFNTDIAVRQINKYNLSTAIFAPGYVYQNQGGNKNYSRFEQLDDKLWFGKSFAQKEISYEEWTRMTDGWKLEGDEAVTSAFNCIRSYTYPLADNNQFDSITFSVKIRGTPPNVKDPYIIVLQLLDSNNNPFKFVSTGNGYQFAKEQLEEIKLRIEISQEQRAKTKSVRVIQTGRDAQNWGGHYGTRFKQQKLYLNYWKKQQSISNLFYQRPQSLPYQSFYNVAVGPNFFFYGQKSEYSHGYAFLADYDLPYQNKFELKKDKFDQNFNSSLVQINYDQSNGWIGAGSLKLSSSSGKFAFRLVKVQQKISKINIRIKIKSNIKQIPMIGLKFKDSTQLFKSQTQKLGNWIQLAVQAKFQSFKDLNSIYLVSNSDSLNTVMYIGQISIFSQEQKLINQQLEPQLVALRCAITSVDCVDLYVNLKSFPKLFKSIFIQINDKIVGTLYQKTGYFEELTGSLNSLTIRLLGLSHTGQIYKIYQDQK